MANYRDWEQLLQYISTAVEHGDSAKQIADHLGMEVKRLTRQLRRMSKRGIKVPVLVAEKPHRPVGVKRKPFTGRQKSDECWEEIRNNVLQWLQENVSRKVIAERIGIQIQSLSNRLYRWRKEGYPVPVAPRPRRDNTVRLQRKQEAEDRKKARVFRKEEKARIWSQRNPVPHVRRPEKRIEKRLPDRVQDTSKMVYVQVDSKTKIQIPVDKDPEIAISEWKKRYKK